MTDDGHTVALPLTQEQACMYLRGRMRGAEDPLHAVLSAPPEVLAAALGGWAWVSATEGVVIEIPQAREADGT